MKSKYNLDTAVITGTIDGRTTVKGLKATLNNVLTCFSPISKSRDVLMPGSKTEIDILIATDCISEGQNLQDCDYLVNYDIHWNPVRIIQRFGRIDRIGSRNQYIQLVNFWPDMDLDDYINLKSRVETRMKISVMTSTGDDDLINPEEKGDLEYRKQQLKRLQEEVVDIEDMSSGKATEDLYEYADARAEYVPVEVIDGEPEEAGLFSYYIEPYMPLDEDEIEECLEDLKVTIPEMEKDNFKEWEKTLAFSPADEVYEPGDASKAIPLSEYAYICPQCFNEVFACTCRSYPYNLIQIDKLLVPIIKELNTKGSIR